MKKYIIIILLIFAAFIDPIYADTPVREEPMSYVSTLLNCTYSDWKEMSEDGKFTYTIGYIRGWMDQLALKELRERNSNKEKNGESKMNVYEMNALKDFSRSSIQKQLNRTTYQKLYDFIDHAYEEPEFRELSIDVFITLFLEKEISKDSK